MIRVKEGHVCITFIFSPSYDLYKEFPCELYYVMLDRRSQTIKFYSFVH